MISLLEYILCGMGIHKLSEEIVVMDGEAVHRCENCLSIFQAKNISVRDALLLEQLALLWHIFADHSSPFSATVRACGRRRLTKLGQDRLSYGWQAWLRRRARTSFFSALLP